VIYALIALFGAALMGGSFMFGFYAGLRFAPKDGAPQPKLIARKGGSSILEYGDPTQADYE